MNTSVRVCAELRLSPRGVPCVRDHGIVTCFSSNGDCVCVGAAAALARFVAIVKDVQSTKGS